MLDRSRMILIQVLEVVDLGINSNQIYVPELFHFLFSFFLTIDTIIFAKFNKLPSLKWDPRLYYPPPLHPSNLTPKA